MTAKSRPAPRSTTAIRRDEEVQKALAQTAPGAEETAPVRRKRDLLWLAVWGGGVALAGALYLLVELRVFSVTGGSFSLVQRIALAAMKQNFNAAENGSLSELLDLEARRQIETGNTEDHKEAARAFVEKRAPVFRGR